ncbi:MAG: hypothetical protein ACFFAU_13855 [Candidatus Hodarchaeota archaeon]
MNEVFIALLGAVFALMLRELFSWKESGRKEAIIHHETLVTECYGKMIPLIHKMSISDNILMGSYSDYNHLLEIFYRFSHRFPANIEKRLFWLLFEAADEEDPIFNVIFGNRDQAIEFKNNLINDLKKINQRHKDEIDLLESYVQTIRGRIFHLFFRWNFSTMED